MNRIAPAILPRKTGELLFYFAKNDNLERVDVSQKQKSMPQLVNPAVLKPQVTKIRLGIAGGVETTLHIASYNRRAVQLRVKVFDPAVKLLDWCKENEQPHAINGGFFVRSSGVPLGEVWLGGKRYASAAFAEGWNTHRASIHSSAEGIVIDRFCNLPDLICGDVLQAGPMLLKDGQVTVKEGLDSEGFSSTSYQFDSDITLGRYPRAALGLCDNRIYLVVC